MRAQQEIRDMLKKFDDVNEEGELDEGGEGIRDALLWVLGLGRSNDDLEEYLEDF